MPVRVLAASLLLACAMQAQQRPLLSAEKEAALGTYLAKEFRATNPMLAAPEAKAYIEDLAQRLAVHLPAGVPPFTFEIIAARGSGLREPNVLPHGYIFVPAGLFRAATEEDEFAGVLAHSLAHAAARHGWRPIRAPVSVPIVFGPGPGGFHGDELAIPLGFRRALQQFESEADGIAIEIMTAAGYDPLGFYRYIDRHQVDRQPAGYSVGPLRDQRLAAIATAIAGLPARREYRISSGHYARIRDIVEKLLLELTPKKLNRKVPHLRPDPVLPVRE